MARKRKKRKGYGLPKPKPLSKPTANPAGIGAGGGPSAANPHGTGGKPAPGPTGATVKHPQGGVTTANPQGSPTYSYPTGGSSKPSKPSQPSKPDQPTTPGITYESKYTDALAKNQKSEMFTAGFENKKSQKSGDQLLKDLAAREYKRRELAQIALNNYDITPEGEVRKEDQEVPVPRKGVSQADINKATRKTDKEIARFKEKVRESGVEVPKKQVRGAVQYMNAQLLKSLYKTTKKGELKTKTIKAPVIRTSPEQVQADLDKMNKTARNIRKSDNVPSADFYVPPPAEDKHEPLLFGVDQGHEPVPPGGVQVAREAELLPQTQEQKDALEDESIVRGANAAVDRMNEAGILPVNPVVAKGSVAVDHILAQFNRPVRFTESALGKYWTALGLIKGDTAEEIRAAKDPFSAFLANQTKTDGLVTGNTLSQGLVNDPRFGIAFDLALDPLMYVGAKGLSKNVPKTPAIMAAKIERAGATDALDTARFLRLGREAQRSGDLTELTNYLDEVIKTRGVSRRPLGPRARLKVRQSIKQGHNEDNSQLLDDIVTALEKAPQAGDKKIVLPGKLAQEVVARSMAATERTRSLRPGFEINIGNPLAPTRSPWLRLKAPFKGPLERILVPTSITKKGLRREAVESAARAADEGALIRDDAIAANTRIEDLAKELREARKSGDSKEIGRLRSEIRHAQDDFARISIDAAEQAAGLPPRPFERLDQFIARKNRQHLVREPQRQMASMARQIETDLQEHTFDATKPLRDDEDLLLRNTLFRNAQQDTGDLQWLLTAMGEHLAPDEVKAIKDLAAINKAIGKHGKAAGTLGSMVEDYVTRQVQRTGRVMGHATDDPFAGHSTGSGAGPTGPMYAARHRNAPEMASLADPEMLAKAIQQAGRGKITLERARDIAEQWHRMGSVRSNIENLARSLQRGEARNINDLTPMQRRALDWSNFVSDDGKPLFSVEHEGWIELAPTSRHHGFDSPDDVFEGLTDLETRSARLHSALLDRASADRMVEELGPGKARDEWITEKERLDAAIEEYDVPAKEFGKAAKESLVPRLDALDREIAAIIRHEHAVRDAAPLERLLTEIDETRAYVNELDDLARERYAKDSEELFDWYDRSNEYSRRLEAQRVEVADDLRAAQRITRNAPKRTASEVIAERKGVVGSDPYGLKRDETYGFEWGSDTPVSKVTARKYQELVRRNVHSYDDPIIPGSRRVVGRRQDINDPFDFTGRLDDLRSPGDKTFFEMDPRIAQIFRIRAEAGKTAFFARWRGLDEQIGISVDRAKGKIGITRDGREIPTHELKSIYDHHTDSYSWVNLETEEFFGPTDLDFPDKLIPTVRDADGMPKIWRDINGREYMRPADIDNILGREIQQLVGPDRLWPTDIMQDVKGELLRMGDTGFQGIFETGMHNLYQRAVSQMRYWVTVPFPAYHVRNMVSDVLKSLQADTGVAFHPIQNARMTLVTWGRKHVSIKFGKHELSLTPNGIKVPGFPRRLTMEEFLFVTDIFGIRSSRHMTEFMDLAKTGAIPSKWQRRLSPGAKGKLGQWGLEFGARREDMIRYQTFMQAMRRNNGDVAEAAWYMIKHHFDYGDLTSGERRVARNLFLFYTWYRNNIPLQFMEMITRPGFFSAVASTYSELQAGGTPLNRDWSKYNPLLPDMTGPVRTANLLPDYMSQDLGAFVVPWNGHAAAFGIGAPWVDINTATRFLDDPQGALRNLATLTAPPITLLIQFAYRNDLLTGREFNEFERTSPEVGALADKLGKVLGGDWLQHDDDGNATIPWALNVAFRNLPFFGRASSYLLPPDAADEQGRLTKYKGWLGWGLGLNVKVSPTRSAARPYYEDLFRNKVGELSSYERGLSGVSSDDRKKLIKKWENTKLYPWAKEKGIPPDVMRDVEGHTRYLPQSEREDRRDKGFDLSTSATPGELTLPPLKQPKNDKTIPGLAVPDSVIEQLNGGSGSVKLPSPGSGQGSAGGGHSLGELRSVLPAGIGAGSGPKVVKVINGGAKGLTAHYDAKEAAHDLVKAVRKVDSSGGKFLDNTLTPEQQQFARGFAAESKTSLTFATAAVLYEGGNGTKGDQNWLNIGWTGSSRANITYNKVWQGDPHRAGELTAKWLRGDWGQQDNYVASQGIQAVGQAALEGASDKTLSDMWASSGWAASGNGPGTTYDRARAAVRETPVKKLPKDVLRQARKTLGAKATKALLNGGELMQVTPGKDKHKLSVKELFYDGADRYYDNGTWTEGQFGGHGDHVHFASEDPISMMLVVRKAQELGMLQGSVGENPAYDTIDAHDPNSGSYHVRSEPMPNGPYAKKLEKATGASGDVMGQAIDIAGDADLMAKMRTWIEKHMGKGAPINDGIKIKGTNLMVVTPAQLNAATIGADAPSSGAGGTSATPLPANAQGAGMSQEDRIMHKMRKSMRREALRPTDAATSALEALQSDAPSQDTTGLEGTYLTDRSISTASVEDLIDELKRRTAA